MREIFRHNPGRIFLVILLLSVISILWVPKYFFKPHIFFGWLPLPFLAGIIFVLVWLLAYLIYLTKILKRCLRSTASSTRKPLCGRKLHLIDWRSSKH